MAPSGKRVRRLPDRDKRSGGEFALRVLWFSCRNHKRTLGLGVHGILRLPVPCQARSLTAESLKIRNLAAGTDIQLLGQKSKEQVMQGIANPPGGNPVSDPQASKTSTLVLIFRIVRWRVYACALIVLILLLHKPSPPVVSTTPEAAARAEQKFQDVQQAAAQGQPATLRMSETELNSYLASHLVLPAANTNASANANAPTGTPSATSSGSVEAAPNADQTTMDDVEQMRSNVKDVKVQLVDDHVRAYVVFDVHGKDVTLQLVGKLGADNGFLKFEPVSGQIGSLPIPQAVLEAAVRKMMESPENREKLKLPSDISNLKIENGEVVTQFQ
jgi:hypothetical protein